MKRLGIIAALVLGLSWQCEALTLDEAVIFALANNHRIKQFERIEGSAREGVGSKRGAFMPRVDLSYSYTDLETTGGTPAGSAFNRDVSAATAQASYNLFNGFSDLKSLKEAELRAEAAGHDRKAAEADIALETKEAYIEVLRAGRAVEVAREGVDLLSRQKRDADLFYREGLFAKNDVLKVDVELSTARQDLIGAEGGYRVARKRLERAMGVPLAEEEKIEDIGVPSAEGYPSYEEMSAEAFQMRSELRSLRAIEAAQRRSMEAVRGGYLPSLDFTVSRSEFGDTASPDGRESLHDGETRAVVTATWNVFDGFSRKHDVSGARLLAEATAEQISDAEEEVRLQLREATEGYEVSQGKLSAAETAVGQAEENYRVTENQFRERLATSTDLLDARLFLTRARNQRNNALYDLHIWAARIDRIVERGRAGEGTASAQ